MSQKPAILLLHGALGSAVQLQAHADALEQHFRVHSFTFSGHGGMGDIGKPFTISGFGRELAAWLEAQALPPMPVFGYSMGGYVALWLARQPKQYFTHILTYGTKFAWSPEAALQESKRLQPEALEAKLPQFALALARRHHPHDWKLVMERTAQLLLALGHTPLLTEKELGEIGLPTTILLGSEDRMVSEAESRQAASQLPNASFRLLQGQGHPIEQLAPQLLLQEVLAALQPARS
ncbi:alpha/beta fold hydrolase [Cesiribacter andamanensis]|uniref:Acetoin dehydrogenase E2 subunit dihydrolipoyllysine-residue acetyltransferase n=1 Tax=Cesiribacter andamanensis AMV16 TaxID=1279009 RepID=M7P1B1_9BACT|nr:alpha/beta fold hydrolase [Cesiribacter andamanensis]EMR04394.1 acetoin dehydrogenase E2 subunit dihydrolipoyllysine-residue acetyltransferase [Cesiribacter andamanensis AMV16]